jgi:DNA-directed RNA polymerase subunit F
VIAMIGKKVLETEPISVAEVKKVLEEFSEENELSYEQNLTLDHVRKFSKITFEASEKPIEELLEPLGQKKYAIKVAYMMPEDLADLRLLFAKERIPYEKEKMEKVLEIVDKYRDEIEELPTEEVQEEPEEETQIVESVEDSDELAEVQEEETETDTE